MSKLLKLDVNIKYDITVIGAGPAKSCDDR